MARSARTAAALLTAVVAGLALSSCSVVESIFDPGPPRDAEGSISETTVTSSLNLLVGDCFTFTDEADYSEVEVTPCGKAHTYVVIGQGEMLDADITAAGSVQNAVSSSCSEVFTEFKAAAAEGVRPKQEFIVSIEEREGGNVTLYTCVATDSPSAS